MAFRRTNGRHTFTNVRSESVRTKRFRMPRPTLYYDDEDGEGSPDSMGYIEEDHPLQLHGNRELAAQAVKLLQVPSRPDDASFASSTTDMDVPIYVRGPSASSLGNKVKGLPRSISRRAFPRLCRIRRLVRAKSLNLSPSRQRLL